MQMRPLVLALASAGLLNACGSGGSSDSSGPGSGPNSGPVTLTGVVARGAAIVGATVTAKCAVGSGTATTGSDGSYSLAITTAKLPCALEATKTGDSVLPLHSVATTPVANITSITELVVAQLTGKLPSTYFASLDASTVAAGVTSSKVSTAQTKVKETLTSAGVNGVSSLGDVITGTLTAGSGTGYDGVLDALATTLASTGTTLAQLTQTVADTSAATPSSSGGSGSSASGSVNSAAVSLPADLLLKPKASNCDALRSGSYRFIIAGTGQGNSGNSTEVALDVGVLNATTLTFTWLDGTTDTLTPAGSCRYTFGSGGEMAVSPAGVLVAKTLDVGDGAVPRLVVAIPIQTIAVSELAGTWNHISWEWDSSTGAFVSSGILTIDSAGQTTSGRCDTDTVTPGTPEASCPPASINGGLDSNGHIDYQPLFTVNPDGGFDVRGKDWNWTSSSYEDWYARAFAYRTGSGELVVVFSDAQGEVGFLTRKNALSLPTNGTARSFWSVEEDTSMVASANTSDTVVTGVDSAAGSYTRDHTPQGSATRSETLFINRGRDGWTHRLASPNVREWYGLGITGAGLTMHWFPAVSGGAAAKVSVSVRLP